MEKVCCQDENCPQMSNSTWSCSKSYTDQDYALTFCPLRKNKCGGQWKFDFSNNKNVSTNITIQNLTKGESCTIKVKSSCGAPAFQILDNANVTDTSVYITYIEYNEKNLNVSGSKSDYNKDSKQRKAEKPDDERPMRNSNWTDQGDQGSKTEQKAPERKYKNGTTEQSEKINDRRKKKEDYYKNVTNDGTDLKSEEEMD